MRLTNHTDKKYRLFVQGQAGIQHDEFDNAFVIVPGVGVVIPLEGQRFSANAGFDLPIAFFNGFTTKDYSFYGGIGFPLGGTK